MNFKGQSTGVKSFVEVKSKTSLSPCHYNPGEAYIKSQPDYEKSCLKFMPKSKHDLSFIEYAAKSKAHMPPPGNYKNLEKAMDYQYKGASPRYKRGV